MVKDIKLYNILNIPETASPADIKKAYRNLALKHHPDKGGDPEKFKEISRAYEILSNEEKRSTYDRFGEEGLDGNNMHNAEDIFAQFFNGFNPFNGMFSGNDAQRGRHSRTQDIIVTLEDLYNGTTKEIEVPQQIKCTICDGTGCKHKSANTQCQNCQGRGICTVTRQLGPMIQQMQHMCPNCKGKGSFINESDKCVKCHGNKVTTQIKKFEININKGMEDESHIIVPGDDGSEDTIFIIREAQHENFQRQGHDLIMIKKISLVEALCGVSFILQHLDGRLLNIKSSPQQIIKFGSIFTISNEGMPYKENSSIKGTLYIKFIVEFPDIISDTQRNLIQQAFDEKVSLELPQNTEIKILEPVCNESRRQSKPAAERVQCAQQ